MWTLSGMPSWLTPSEEYGSTNPRSETIVTFSVNPATPIGKYEETIYLKGNDGIEIPLTLNFCVTGELPQWNLNPRDFETSMNVIGRVELLGMPLTDADDILAAFVGDECRGVAHLEYKDRYDGYYATINIYGNSGDENKPITFRAYDALTGNLYPAVEPDRNIKFEALTLIGKYADPVVFNLLDKIEQSTELKAGWNWISLNVKAEDMNTQTIFEKIATESFTSLIGKAAIASSPSCKFIPLYPIVILPEDGNSVPLHLIAYPFFDKIIIFSSLAKNTEAILSPL